MSISSAEIILNLFRFISEQGNDLNPDHYQLAIRSSGLGAVLVAKYIKGSPDKEKELGHIGLF